MELVNEGVVTEVKFKTPDTNCINFLAHTL